MSITRTALEKGGFGKVVLFYANRDEQSVIFGNEIAELPGVRRPAGRRALAGVGAGYPQRGTAARVRVVLHSTHGVHARPRRS